MLLEGTISELIIKLEPKLYSTVEQKIWKRKPTDHNMWQSTSISWYDTRLLSKRESENINVRISDFYQT